MPDPRSLRTPAASAPSGFFPNSTTETYVSPTVPYQRFCPGAARVPKVKIVPVKLGAPGTGTLGWSSLKCSSVPLV